MVLCESRPKRPQNSKIPTGEAVRRLHQAVTPRQRRSTTAEVLMYLKSNKHFSVRFFDTLLQVGIAQTLCMQLGFIINRLGGSKDAVENICGILSIVYSSCTVEARKKFLSEIGPELFKLLLRGLSSDTVFPVLSLFHICSSNIKGALMLLESRVIQSISPLIQNMGPIDLLVIEILGLLKNLSYFGEDRRHEIAEHTVLMSHLAHLAFTRARPEEPIVSGKISAIFRNLAVSPPARPFMVQNSNCLAAAVQMCSTGTTHRQTHRNVLNFLLSLSQESDSCIIICLHGDSMILNLLKRLLVVKCDSVIRQRAVRVLRLLACDASVPLIVHDTDMLSSLADRAMHDISSEVRTEATHAIVRIATFVKSPMPQHQLLLHSLTQLCSSPTAQVESLAQAFMKQAAQRANRLPMIEQRMLVNSLAQIAISVETTKAAKKNACFAIHDLIEEEPYREQIATCAILEALVMNSLQEDQYQHHVIGIKALVNLAAVPVNRKTMVSHRRLLRTMLQYASSSTDENLKKNVKKAILKLVLEL